MKISASIYSNPTKPLEQIAKELALFQVDYLHVDCNDDMSVFDDIAHIRKSSTTPIDLHIITSNPEAYYDSIRKNGVELVAFQHENLDSPLDYPDDLSARLGISFTSETAVEEFEHYKDTCSFVLFMTTTPGQSGGVFDSATFDRIRQFKQLYPHKRIHVDGGVTDEVSFILRNLGVYCAISGSYLVKAPDMPEALIKLKSDGYRHDYHVKEFMVQPNELPIVREKDASNLESVLRAVDRSKMGFTLVVDDSMNFVGVVTDGDIRRAVLSNITQLESLGKVDLVNRSAISVRDDISVKGMLELISQHERPLLFLPVVDSKGRLVGAISFNNLVKGEL